MGMQASYVDKFFASGLIVQTVVAATLLSLVWIAYIVVERTTTYRHARKIIDRFEGEFWSGGSLEQLAEKLRSSESAQSIESMFIAAMRFWDRCMKNDAWSQPDFVERSMQTAFQVTLEREVQRLEKGLLTLSVYGSFAGALLGLFGAIWTVYATVPALQLPVGESASGGSSALELAVLASAAAAAAAVIAKIFHERFRAEVRDQRMHLELFWAEFEGIIARNLREQAAKKAKATR